MLHARAIAPLCLLAAVLAAPAGRAAPAEQAQVVDRIAARIGDDIITSSELHDLAAYQQLVDGQAQPDDRLLSELIEQWVVNAEATAAQFPPAADSEVDREVARIESRFTNPPAGPPQPQAYVQRLAELGMTPESVRRMVARQIFLARYLDYKFRPAVQVEDSAVEAYYQKVLLPALAAKNQQAPPLDTVLEQIHELLVQQGISERASSWVEETKSRLDIEIDPGAGAPSAPGAGAGSTRSPGK